MKDAARPSPLALAILALLYEEPMHPYRIQQKIKGRGKDEVINVRSRASLYQTIERLERAGLIAVHETARAENRPERTLYALTDTGREAVLHWLRAMLATPAREFPEFPAALAHMALLSPEDALQQLEKRAKALREENARIDAQLGGFGQILPRLFLLELEYVQAILRAELAWLESVVDDLRAGRLTWEEERLRAIAQILEADTTERSEP